MIKLAANAALMTRISFINEIANVCEATGRRRRQGRRGSRPRPADRQELPPRRHRLRRLVLPEGQSRPQAARGELRLPLPGAECGDRGQRAAEAARDREAASRGSARFAARRSRCSGSRSSPTRTTRARRPLSCSRDDCSPRVPTSSRGIPSRGPTGSSASTRWQPSRRRLRGADAVVLVTEWPELAEVDWPAVARSMSTAVFVDGRNMLDPQEMHDAGFRYDAIGRAASNGIS